MVEAASPDDNAHILGTYLLFAVVICKPAEDQELPATANGQSPSYLYCS